MGIFAGIFLLIFSYLLLIVIATVVGIGTIIGFFWIQVLLCGGKNYLLFVSDSNIIVAMGLIIFGAVYATYRIDKKLSRGKGKLFDTRSNRIINKFDRAPRSFKIAYIIVLLGSIYYGITSYGVLYEDKIKVSSPLSPIGVTYEYSDIKSVEVGIEKALGKSYVPYYNIKFNDNKVVDLLGEGTRDEKDGRYAEDILLDLDNQLKAQGVIKTVNKDNFSKYSKGLDKDYVNKIEELFEK